MTAWDRRTFLKFGTAGTAGLVVAGPARAGAPKPWNARADRILRKYRDPAPTVCRSCPAGCAVHATRDGDRVVQVQGNPGAPTNRGGVCARAYAGLERVYDPGRVLHPLRRAGPRGAGRWEQISWETALGELASRLAGADRAVLHLGQEDVLATETADALGIRTVLVDEPLPGRPGPADGADLYGTPVLGYDFVRAHTVYLFGALPLDGAFRVPEVRALTDARAAGADVRLFSPFQGATGSLAEWTPVPPGTEVLVALGIARWILDEGEADVAAMRPYVAESVNDWVALLAPYTTNAVAEATGISPERLRRLAVRFSRGRPAVAVAPQGGQAAVAAALLNHLVGAVNAAGGIQTARGPYFTRPLPVSQTPEGWFAARETVDVYWAVDANPAYGQPGGARVTEFLADPSALGFTVVSDTHLTETARLADLFLPLATPYECWGLVEGCLPDGRPYLFLQQPVTRAASEPDKLKDPGAEPLSLFEPWPRPLGEARGPGDVLLDLARRADPDAGFAPSVRAHLEELLRKSWGPGSLPALRRRGLWVAEEAKAPDPGPQVRLAERVPKKVPAPGDGLLLIRLASAVVPGRFAAARWGREVDHRGSAWLNPGTARTLGIRSGDEIVLTTGAGEARVEVRTLRGLHPRAVAVPDGFGRDEQPGDGRWWETGGTAVRALYPVRLRTNGTQDWGPLPVSVRKG